MVVDRVVDKVDGVDRVPRRLRLGPEGVRLGPEVGFQVGPQRYFRGSCRRYRGVFFWPRASPGSPGNL